jgi:hypothetical protein
LQLKLTSLGLSSTQKYNKSSTIHKSIWEYRDSLISQIEEYNKEVDDLKKQRAEKHIERESLRNKAFIDIYKEIFSDAQKAIIGDEIDRRVRGEEPMPIGLNYKDFDYYKGGFYKYRDELKKQLEKLIEFRILLTDVIEKGCKQCGDAEFMKIISPLNRLIIPLEELRKIKLKNNL